MRHDLFVFLLALFDHWIAIVSGGVLSVVVIFVEKKFHRTISWKHVAWVMVTAFVVSCFLTWRDEYTTAERRGNEIGRLNGIIGQMRETKPPQPAVAVFAECDPIPLSIEIPPHGTIRIVPVNEKGMKAVNWGSHEIENDADKPKQWPGKEKLLRARRLHDPGVIGYRCEISNHGKVNLLNVGIPMRFWFGNKGGDQNAVKYTPIIGPLDAGKDFVLYFVNDCPTNAEAVLPDDAIVIVAGETASRKTKLYLPERNPLDPIMMWFPTKIRWVGSTACD
jgi:hypothetical protein